MSSKTADERITLIKENLAEFLNPEIIETIINEGRNPRIYWGTATVCLASTRRQSKGMEKKDTGRPHAGYLVPGVKIAQLLAAGCDMVILLADIHGFLDNLKAPIELVEHRVKYYRFAITALLQACGVSTDKVEFVLGLDQRKLFTAAKEWLPKLGYRQRAHLMNDMIPGLQGGKMSSSDENSKIDLLDPPDVVTKKIKKAEAAPRVAEGNGLLAYVEHVFLPVAELKGKREFIVLRERDGLEPLVYTTIAQMRSDYENDVLTPQLLKPAVTKALHDILIPIQDAYNASKEWQEITLLAYPPPEKKAKKVKKIGTRYAGTTQDSAAPDAVDGVAKLNIGSEN
ncbi:hypothetical protein NPX13_g10187 [Xylaria arbuscula]|uniref:tyrosine--tRNA ligase n=1 Tax=Xylaria arbuscula TaxID=114810 RepID=A0A9W8TIA9_9PEZI|nr:hypothetical protein NPX13_g10187 [Xylaria arbuscula]